MATTPKSPLISILVQRYRDRLSEEQIFKERTFAAEAALHQERAAWERARAQTAIALRHLDRRLLNDD